MPTVGFGTAGLGDATEQAVLDALSSGHRLIDSAQVQPSVWLPWTSSLDRKAQPHSPQVC